MVYGIIREHNGSVEVESKPGKGSTFKNQAASEPGELQGKRVPSGQGFRCVRTGTATGRGIMFIGGGRRSLGMKFSTRIMIVDDEETICESLQAWFVRDGYQVETALSGEAALKLVEESPADIYLVDIKMPGMDGIEFLSRLKERQPNAIAVMMTAHGTIQTAVDAMKSGATDYFCKPFDPDELSLFMERILANKALREENIALKELLNDRHEGFFDVFIVHSEPMQGHFRQDRGSSPFVSPDFDYRRNRCW